MLLFPSIKCSKFSNFVNAAGTSVSLLLDKLSSTRFFRPAKASGILEILLPESPKYFKFVNNSIPYVDR